MSGPARLTVPRTESATARLRQEILRGELAPGDLLAESAVAVRLGVSRVPVREALFALEREGLVIFGPTGRAFVRELTHADFEELFTLRLTLEPMAARLASPRVRADASALEANIAATGRAKTIEEITRLDLEFHELILRASGNARLLKLWLSLRSELELWLSRLHRQHQWKTRGTREETVVAHRKLLSVLRKDSPATAERLLRDHINGWKSWLPASAREGQR
jgi:DNA-binding GntR family transcriptional regulator